MLLAKAQSLRFALKIAFTGENLSERKLGTAFFHLSVLIRHTFTKYTNSMLEVDNIELLYDSTCIPMKTELSSDQQSLEIQTKSEDDQFPADIINDEFKALDTFGQIKAPANCFLLYRSHVLKEITARYPGHSSRSITSIIAENWKNEPLPVKNHFKEIAAKDKAQFKKRFPEYR